MLLPASPYRFWGHRQVSFLASQFPGVSNLRKTDLMCVMVTVCRDTPEAVGAVNISPLIYCSKSPQNTLRSSGRDVSLPQTLPTSFCSLLQQSEPCHNQQNRFTSWQERIRSLFGRHRYCACNSTPKLILIFIYQIVLHTSLRGKSINSCFQKPRELQVNRHHSVFHEDLKPRSMNRLLKCKPAVVCHSYRKLATLVRILQKQRENMWLKVQNLPQIRCFKFKRIAKTEMIKWRCQFTHRKQFKINITDLISKIWMKPKVHPLTFLCRGSYWLAITQAQPVCFKGPCFETAIENRFDRVDLGKQETVLPEAITIQLPRN